MIEILARGSPEARRLAWSPAAVRGGVACTALISDPGRLSSPSRLARRTSPRGEQSVVVRYVPREELRRRRPPLPRLLLRALRWETTSASLVPVGLGLLLDGRAGAVITVAVLFATLALHVGANLVSDAFEHAAGDDALLRWGGSKVLQEGWFSATSFLRVGAALSAGAVITGAAIVSATGSRPLLLVGFVGTLLAWQFVGPPLRLHRRVLGDVILFVTFGPLLLCGARLAVGATIDGITIAAGFVTALPPALARHLRNLRRLPDDAMLGHRTLAAALGFRGSKLVIVMIAAAMVLGPPLGAIGGAPLTLLGVAVMAAPIAWALRPALGAFAPHDPALTRALRRIAPVNYAYGAALIAAWAIGRAA